jgi:hypothetical protein
LARPPFSTIPARRLPVLVVIAPDKGLLDACHETLRYVSAARVEVADVRGAATLVASKRPFAVVLEEDVFSFDPSEFEALGRDVGAEIVLVPANIAPEDRVPLLLPRLKAAFKKWEQADDSFA